jgi:hypothetical protein
MREKNPNFRKKIILAIIVLVLLWILAKYIVGEMESIGHPNWIWSFCFVVMGWFAYHLFGANR